MVCDFIWPVIVATPLFLKLFLSTCPPKKSVWHRRKSLKPIKTIQNYLKRSKIYPNLSKTYHIKHILKPSKAIKTFKSYSKHQNLTNLTTLWGWPSTAPTCKVIVKATERAAPNQMYSRSPAKPMRLYTWEVKTKRSLSWWSHKCVSQKIALVLVWRNGLLEAQLFETCPYSSFWGDIEWGS